MILRDEIVQIKSEKVEDGMGGFTRTNKVWKNIECKVSLNTSPEVANAYGVSGEQIIYVATRSPLDETARYIFKDKHYTVRFQTHNNRLSFSTLVEVKKE